MWTPDCSLEVEAVGPICLDFHSNPGYLSCIHIFCLYWTKNWMARKEELILTCPMCREENQRPILHKWVISELIILIKQHGSLREQPMDPWGCAQRTWLWKMRVVNPPWCPLMTWGMFAVGSLVLGGRSSRFTLLTSVLQSFHVSLVFQEADVGKQQEWTPGVCKESVSRRDPSHNLAEDWEIYPTASVLDSSQVSFIWHWEIDEGKGHEKSSLCISFMDSWAHSFILNNQWKVTVVPHLNIFLWVIQPFLGCRGPSPQEG